MPDMWISGDHASISYSDDEEVSSSDHDINKLNDEQIDMDVDISVESIQKM